VFDDHVGIVGTVVVKKTRDKEMFVRFLKFQLMATHITDRSNIFASNMTMMSDLPSVNRKFMVA